MGGSNELLLRSDELMVEMFLASEKGISPSEFRKSRISDIMFIRDLRNAREKIMERKQHEHKIMETIRMMQGGMHRG